ncbi:hypothetical protein CVT26_001301 [Gymnopilus dilepis]|uniref:Uncharacterized protein n=1 Tax=Gymnopilus dilepis TaxID=231916 RepID=A0A409Y248_9AGAR|nr:hypothetical protein CVT26_001301 [Gymnopilus dilepis]
MASSTPICQFTRSPPLNTDIAGIGVRISTGLIAWLFTFIPLFVFALGSGMVRTRSRFRTAGSRGWDSIQMELSSHIMLVLHVGYTVSLLRNYATFGSTPECNHAARIFFFGTHRVTNTWFISWTIVYAISLVFIYSMLLKASTSMLSQKASREEGERKDAGDEGEGKDIKEPTTGSNVLTNYLRGTLTFIALVIWIAFTEVTVVKNDFAPSDAPAWQFGQIFPMILLAVPALAAARAVAEFIQHTGEKTMGKDEEYALSDLPATGQEEKTEEKTDEGDSPTVESIEVS